MPISNPNVPIKGVLYDESSSSDKIVLYPETSPDQVKYGNGSILDVLPTPEEKKTLQEITPVETGTVTLWSGETLPARYLYADGSYYYKSEKQNLYKILGTRFGESIDKLKFAVPNLQPHTVTGLGEDYVLHNPISITGGTEISLNSLIYCKDNIRPFIYGYAPTTNIFHIKIYTDDDSVERSSVSIAITGGAGLGSEFNPVDGLIYHASASGIYTQVPLQPTFDKLDISLPTGFCSFCVDMVTGDLFLLASPATTTGNAIYRFNRSTGELLQLCELNSILNGNGTAAARPMIYDHNRKILYFSMYNLLEDATKSYRICTYNLETEVISIGEIMPNWPRSFQFTCGDVYAAINPSLYYSKLNSTGNFVYTSEVLPLRVNTTNTGNDSVCYLPNGIPYWLSTNALSSTRTYKLNATTVSRKLYYIIRE